MGDFHPRAVLPLWVKWKWSKNDKKWTFCFLAKMPFFSLLYAKIFAKIVNFDKKWNFWSKMINFFIFVIFDRNIGIKRPFWGLASIFRSCRRTQKSMDFPVGLFFRKNSQFYTVFLKKTPLPFHKIFKGPNVSPLDIWTVTAKMAIS